MKKQVFIYRENGEARELAVEFRADALEIRFDGRTDRVESVCLPDGRRSLLCENGRQLCGRARSTSLDTVEVSAGGADRTVRLADPLRDRIAQSVGSSGSAPREEEIRALMPGRVLEVAVRPGESVSPGALLLVVEAMKMQNEIRAERAAVVERVEITAGQAIDAGAVMLTLGPAASTTGERVCGDLTRGSEDEGPPGNDGAGRI